MKNQLIKRIGNAIVSGIPMIQSIRSAIKPGVDVNGNNIPKMNKPDGTLLIQIVVEGAVVIGLAWVMVKFGLTTEDIKSLFGLLGK